MGLGDVVQGFRAGKSPVTNALRHIGYKFTLSVDLKDFFDTVTRKTCRYLSDDEVGKVMVFNGEMECSAQGLPTSPAVANLAALDMDVAIIRFIKKKLGGEVVYTRYADDLTFSFNDFWAYQKIVQFLLSTVSKFGFKINKKKTRLQDARFGKREITGVWVSESGLSVSRRLKRRLRAAKHQHEDAVANGLQEWSMLKPPQDKTQTKKIKDLEKLKEFWGIRKEEWKKVSPSNWNFETKWDGAILTRDPAYILGASSFAKSWTSCFRQGTGCNRATPHYWLEVEGAYLAIIQGKESVTINGVTRKEIAARAWVFKLRNGKHVWESMYGTTSAQTELRKILGSHAKQISSISERDLDYRRQKVVGRLLGQGYSVYTRLSKVNAKFTNQPVTIFKVR